MNNKIKEILEWLKDEDIYVEDYGYQYKRISLKEIKQLLDYITNLQQENAELKKNQRYHKKFGKDYIFCLENDKETYKDYIFELQQENERLQENNSNMQEEMARVWEENERLKFQLENQRIISSKYRMRRNIYKSRCEKASEYIENPSHEMSVLTYQNLLNILQNGSDKE